MEYGVDGGTQTVSNREQKLTIGTNVRMVHDGRRAQVVTCHHNMQAFRGGSSVELLMMSLVRLRLRITMMLSVFNAGIRKMTINAHGWPDVRVSS